ncbi:DUF7289 family protein [Haloarchaeobius sp. TZWWS8]|uniref:DUF7289 family protein n=1 Tax=Haloarchaeobius sp. TZWWS8 TaxID=3446121 RepID=UPI003EBBF59A
MTGSWSLDDRSVSDVLAFTIVFGIVISSVGLVYTVGFGALSEFQEGEQQTNAVRAFDAMSTTFDDIQDRGEPGRAGTLALSGGTIQVVEDSDITISVENASGGEIWSTSRTTGSLRYTLEETTVAYENGGVFRKDRDNSVLVSQPSIRCSPSSDRAVVSVVVLNGESGAKGGDTNVEIVSRENASRLVYLYPNRNLNGTAASVNVTISGSSFDDAWNRHLASSGWDDNGGGEYGCEATQIVVRVTVIDVDFQ